MDDCEPCVASVYLWCPHSLGVHEKISDCVEHNRGYRCPILVVSEKVGDQVGKGNCRKTEGN